MALVFLNGGAIFTVILLLCYILLQDKQIKAKTKALSEELTLTLLDTRRDHDSLLEALNNALKRVDELTVAVLGPSLK